MASSCRTLRNVTKLAGNIAFRGANLNVRRRRDDNHARSTPMLGNSSATRLFFVFVCSAGTLAFAQTARAESPALEKLLTAKPTKAGLTLTVTTGGCTKKSDFEIKSHRLRKRVASIEVHRLAPDTCKGNFPQGMELSFSWTELKVPRNSKILIKNPVEHPTRLGRHLRRHHARFAAMRGCHRWADKSWQTSPWKFW
jgi:hypothetical protein